MAASKSCVSRSLPRPEKCACTRRVLFSHRASLSSLEEKTPCARERNSLSGTTESANTARHELSSSRTPLGMTKRLSGFPAEFRRRENLLPMETKVQPPIDLTNWIEEHRDKFKPPVSNQYLYDGRDFFVMVIKGPNARNDFHLVDSEEYFYQLKGDLNRRTREDGKIGDPLVREGETFFIPPNVPHAPVRPPDTIGVVVERRRPPGEHEHVIFYCDNCGALVEDIDFDCADIVELFRTEMKDFWNDDARRTCKKCGKKVPQPEPVKPFTRSYIVKKLQSVTK